jgi:hypothetical protein
MYFAHRVIAWFQYARSLGTDSTQSLISLDSSNLSDAIHSSEPKNGQPLDLSFPSPLSAGTHVQNSIHVVEQANASRFGDTPLPPPDVQGSLNPQTTVLIGVPHIPETSPISGPVNSLTPTLMPFGETENTRSSSPDTDFLSPSDILSGDQYLTPHDRSLSPQRIHGVVSPPGSPFLDAGMYFELVESRRGAAAQQSGGAGPSSSGIADGTTPPSAILRPVVRGDSEVFSLSSQASSDVSSDEGDYDCASILESELSNWASDIADGERAA